MHRPLCCWTLHEHFGPCTRPETVLWLSALHYIHTCFGERATLETNLKIYSSQDASPFVSFHLHKFEKEKKKQVIFAIELLICVTHRYATSYFTANRFSNMYQNTFVIWCLPGGKLWSLLWQCFDQFYHETESDSSTSWWCTRVD